MKKAILKRLGSFVLVCFMVVLNLVGFVVPASAEEAVQTAKLYEDYYNLDVDEEADLLNGASDLFDGMSPNQSSNDVLYLNGYRICNRSINQYGSKSLVIELEQYAYYVLKRTSGNGAVLLQTLYSNGSAPNFQIPSGRFAGDYSPILFTDKNYYKLEIGKVDDYALFEVRAFDVPYDVSKTSFQKDMQELFNGQIDLSKFITTNLVSSDQRTSPYLDIVAFYSDANWGDWNNPAYQSGNDYLYIYNCYGETPTGGSIRIAGDDYALTCVSRDRFFTKFKSVLPRQFAIDERNLGFFPIDFITLNFTNGSSRIYPFQNFYITIEYTNRTDWQVKKVSFSGEQKLKLDIDYTYWRQADYSTKGIGWHNQIDSIYFGIPNALLQGLRLVDAKLEYQKVTTKPIVVTETDEYIEGDSIPGDPSGNRTYVHEWFETTAKHPDNELTSDWGWVRYQKGKPYFSTFDDYFSFNIRGSGHFNEYLKSVYWAFDVEDPTIVDKVPNTGSTTGLSSSALSHPDASVSPDRLEQWMIHYDLTGATTTYTAANPDYRVGSSVPETVQVNGILFDHAEPRGTYYASQIAGRVLEQFGNNDNFWQNLKVGWNYAFAHLFNTVDEQNVVVGFSDFEIRDISDLNDENGDHKFALADKVDLQNRFRSCKANGETLILMPFDTSQYYSMSFVQGKYKEGNVDSGTEKDFDGYLAIMDMYLDLHVIELYFQNAVGEVIPVAVTSNHINGIPRVTPAPENAELNEHAGEALKNMFRKTGKNIWDFLKKALVIIAVVVIVLVVLRLVMWIVGRKQSNNNTTVVIRDGAPRRNRRRRR